jgi:hypothetical protein
MIIEKDRKIYLYQRNERVGNLFTNMPIIICGNLTVRRLFNPPCPILNYYLHILKRNDMNVIVPVLYKNTEYLVEYNEPDVIAGMKEYTVRIVSIKDRSFGNAEMEEQIGKEFTFRNSDLNENNTPLLAENENSILEVLIKAYRDHIAKDVSGLHRV